MEEGEKGKRWWVSIVGMGGVEGYEEKGGEEYMNEGEVGELGGIVEGWGNEVRDEVDGRVRDMEDEGGKLGEGVEGGGEEEELRVEVGKGDGEGKVMKKMEKRVKKVEEEDLG